MMLKSVLCNRQGIVVGHEMLTSRGRQLRTLQAPPQPRCPQCGGYMHRTSDATGATSPCPQCGWSAGDSLPALQPLVFLPLTSTQPSNGYSALVDIVRTITAPRAHAAPVRRSLQQHPWHHNVPTAPRTLDLVTKMHAAAHALGRVRG